MPRWTPQSKLRQAEIIQAWKPWLHSTGPQTLEGKSVSSQNSWKHGLCAADIRQAFKLLADINRGGKF